MFECNFTDTRLFELSFRVAYRLLFELLLVG